MALSDLTQGKPFPNTTTTANTKITAPSWYTDFLSGLASKGQAALAGASQVAGPSPLQQAAYGGAPSAIHYGEPGTAAAGRELQDVSEAYTPDMIQGFMSPYTSNVVDEMGRLGTQNFNRVLAPGATAGAVGAGQFGSKRGMQVYGNAAQASAQDTLGKQYGALESGYNKALDAAQAEKRIGLDTARGFSDLSNTAYNQAVGGIGVLSNLGKEQQATEQARINQPFNALKEYSGLFGGLNIPTETTATTTGVGRQDQFMKSPLETGLGIASGVGALFAGDKSPGGQLWNWVKGMIGGGEGGSEASPEDIQNVIDLIGNQTKDVGYAGE